TADWRPGSRRVGKDCSRGRGERDINSSPSGRGLKAIAFGSASIHKLNDHMRFELEAPLYDALYAFCRQQVEKQTA
ncbi:MAG TPA: hypothetical protein VG815_04875, partial [Chloroflexota bacterium]|nr:hypothetical protein [Chloroflexota bacterium]